MKPDAMKSERDLKFEKAPEFQSFKEQMGKLLKMSKKELDARVAAYDKNSTRKRLSDGKQRTMN